MTITNPVQIREFENLPTSVNEECNFCPNIANYIVITKVDDNFIVCENCFRALITVEVLLKVSSKGVV